MINKLKSSKEYLLDLKRMIQKRKDLCDLLYSKKDIKRDLDYEIGILNTKIAELDKRISVSTIK